MKLYIAAPYTHPLRRIRHQRFLAVNRAAAALMDAGHVVFSPISHSHPISRYTKADACTSDFWLRQDLPFMAVCDELWIMTLPGSDRSNGIKREMEEARRLEIPIYMVPPMTLPEPTKMHVTEEAHGRKKP